HRLHEGSPRCHSHGGPFCTIYTWPWTHTSTRKRGKHLSPRFRLVARGADGMISWLFPTSKDLLQRSLVPRCYLLPSEVENFCISMPRPCASRRQDLLGRLNQDRKSTRLNSSHGSSSYAVFC